MHMGVETLRGDVAEIVVAAFPRLELWTLRSAVPALDRGALDERLAALSRSAGTVHFGGVRTHRVTSRYRAFARQTGLDPDIERNPLEQAAFQRLLAGRFAPASGVDAALLVAMLETGVPLWALDARQVAGDLRVAGSDGAALVIADGRRSLCDLMRAPGPDVAASPDSDEIVVFTPRVGDVPDTTLEATFRHLRQALGSALA